MEPDNSSVAPTRARAARAAPGTTAYDRYRRTGTFGRLDLLRGLAILGVIWHHTSPPGGPWALLNRGFLGVDLFFALSGFLITTLLLREQDRDGDIAFGPFLGRRALRIYPAYVLLLLLATAVAALSRGTESPRIWHDLPYAASFTSNLVIMTSLLAITWSLAVEQQFYLAVPLLQKFAPRRSAPALLAAAVLSSALAIAVAGRPSTLPEFFTQTTFAPLLWGALLAHTLHAPRGFAWATRVWSGRAALFVTAAVAVALCALPGRDISGWPRVAIQLGFTAVLAACIVTPTVAGPSLPVRILSRIGTVSYGMYLYHLLVMHPAMRLLEKAGAVHPAALFLATTVATWAVAELSLRFFESHFLRRKARLHRLASRPADAVSSALPSTH